MPGAIVCQDVMAWAEAYTGPKFHAMLCDPPYHLTEIAVQRHGSKRFGEPRTAAEQAYRRTATRGFMGKDWDGGEIAFRPETWQALAQHLLPGAFIMAFASSRGYHRLACALEDAGLILHPTIFLWAYGSGFPKATRIDTQIDAHGGLSNVTDEVCDAIVAARQARHLSIRDCDARFCGGTTNWSWYEGRSGGRRMPDGATFAQIAEAWPELTMYQEKVAAREREVLGNNPSYRQMQDTPSAYNLQRNPRITAPATALAATWAGHRYGGQVLKPSAEPIIVAQKPYQGRPVESITATGAGALWIEGARIAGPEPHHNYGRPHGNSSWFGPNGEPSITPSSGRWPPHLALMHLPTCRPVGTRRVQGTNIPGPGVAGLGYHGLNNPHGHINHYTAPDGTETVQAYACDPQCPVFRFDRQAGELHGAGYASDGKFQAGGDNEVYGHNFGGQGHRYGDSGPASRFFPCFDWSLDVAEQLAQADPVFYTGKASRSERDEGLKIRNSHCSIKPISLCTWLATLLLPPAAYAPRRLLVPFSGTSSEMIGAALAGWEDVLGIEQDAQYVEIGKARLTYWDTQIAAQLSLF